MWNMGITAPWARASAIKFVRSRRQTTIQEALTGNDEELPYDNTLSYVELRDRKCDHAGNENNVYIRATQSWSMTLLGKYERLEILFLADGRQRAVLEALEISHDQTADQVRVGDA